MSGSTTDGQRYRRRASSNRMGGLPDRSHARSSVLIYAMSLVSVFHPCLLTNLVASASARWTPRRQASNLVFVSDFATTVSSAQVAGFAGVARAAVTQWRKRHPDFPAPVGENGDRFDLGDVIGWLDGRPIPASSRTPDETAGTTYGDRLRRRLRPAERPDADLLLRSLLALGPQIRR